MRNTKSTGHTWKAANMKSINKRKLKPSDHLIAGIGHLQRGDQKAADLEFSKIPDPPKKRKKAKKA
jgi:hypothetical protein